MNSEREKADILFNYGLPLQFCCHLIQFYTVLSLRTATLSPVFYDMNDISLCSENRLDECCFVASLIPNIKKKKVIYFKR